VALAKIEVVSIATEVDVGLAADLAEGPDGKGIGQRTVALERS
jgi:hypothetical protein